MGSARRSGWILYPESDAVLRVAGVNQRPGDQRDAPHHAVMGHLAGDHLSGRGFYPQGVGGAVLSGYNLADKLGAEIIVKIDSDDQMDPAYLLPLITPILSGETDYTKGNRFLHARELQDMPL